MEKHKEKRAEYLTASQLAQMLQISETTVHRLRKRGKIPAVMITPRLIRFNLKEVRAALSVETEQMQDCADRPEQLAFDDLFNETID